MKTKKKIRVLIVDDSLVFRETLVRAVSKDLGIEVVATASNPYEARDKIVEFRPDVMTLDVNMPRMNGIDFLKRLMPQYPMPVVVVSGLNEKVFEALEAGAVDFILKPDSADKIRLQSFLNELVVKIKVASISKISNIKKRSSQNSEYSVVQKNKKCKVIAIGASTGGTDAIFQVLKTLPKSTPGIVIVQHMPPVFTKMFAQKLNNTCLLDVKEAETGDEIIQGRVLIAPGDYHMRVKKKGSKYITECFKGEKVNGHCPSVDVLFDSVAITYGNDAIGVILTGMGYDGSKGLLKMRQRGAITIGQDEESSVVYGMPKVAFDKGAVGKQLSLKRIGQEIYNIYEGK